VVGAGSADDTTSKNGGDIVTQVQTIEAVAVEEMTIRWSLMTARTARRQRGSILAEVIGGAGQGHPRAGIGTTIGKIGIGDAHGVEIATDIVGDDLQTALDLFKTRGDKIQC